MIASPYPLDTFYTTENTQIAVNGGLVEGDSDDPSDDHYKYEFSYRPWDYGGEKDVLPKMPALGSSVTGRAGRIFFYGDNQAKQGLTYVKPVLVAEEAGSDQGVAPAQLTEYEKIPFGLLVAVRKRAIDWLQDWVNKAIQSYHDAGGLLATINNLKQPLKDRDLPESELSEDGEDLQDAATNAKMYGTTGLTLATRGGLISTVVPGGLAYGLVEVGAGVIFLGAAIYEGISAISKARELASGVKDKANDVFFDTYLHDGKCMNEFQWMESQGYKLTDYSIEDILQPPDCPWKQDDGDPTNDDAYDTYAKIVKLYEWVGLDHPPPPGGPMCQARYLFSAPPATRCSMSCVFQGKDTSDDAMQMEYLRLKLDQRTGSGACGDPAQESSASAAVQNGDEEETLGEKMDEAGVSLRLQSYQFNAPTYSLKLAPPDGSNSSSYIKSDLMIQQGGYVRVRPRFKNRAANRFASFPIQVGFESYQLSSWIDLAKPLANDPANPQPGTRLKLERVGFMHCPTGFYVDPKYTSHWYQPLRKRVQKRLARMVRDVLNDLVLRKVPVVLDTLGITAVTAINDLLGTMPPMVCIDKSEGDVPFKLQMGGEVHTERRDGYEIVHGSANGSPTSDGITLALDAYVVENGGLADRSTLGTLKTGHVHNPTASFDYLWGNDPTKVGTAQFAGWDRDPFFQFGIAVDLLNKFLFELWDGGQLEALLEKTVAAKLEEVQWVGPGLGKLQLSPEIGLEQPPMVLSWDCPYNIVNQYPDGSKRRQYPCFEQAGIRLNLSYLAGDEENEDSKGERDKVTLNATLAAKPVFVGFDHSTGRVVMSFMKQEVPPGREGLQACIADPDKYYSADVRIELASSSALLDRALNTGKAGLFTEQDLGEPIAARIKCIVIPALLTRMTDMFYEKLGEFKRTVQDKHDQNNEAGKTPYDTCGWTPFGDTDDGTNGGREFVSNLISNEGSAGGLGRVTVVWNSDESTVDASGTHLFFGGVFSDIIGAPQVGAESSKEKHDQICKIMKQYQR